MSGYWKKSLKQVSMAVFVAARLVEEGQSNKANVLLSKIEAISVDLGVGDRRAMLARRADIAVRYCGEA
jgi:hypothetical protein